MVGTLRKTYYVCQCDNCKKIMSVEKSDVIYNKAEAVRFLKWSFSRDRKVTCKDCRKHNLNDPYRYK